ncbi:hypothetical protein TRIP_C10076 [Candidatus Zixiibacteriota bacterium]|nr:hypothetical protein TRIP_C10076 [candidate division Zixibacteria bacterium]
MKGWLYEILTKPRAGSLRYIFLNMSLCLFVVAFCIIPALTHANALTKVMLYSPQNKNRPVLTLSGNYKEKLEQSVSSIRKDSSSEGDSSRRNFKILSLLLSFGFGYENLNSSDFKRFEQAGLGKIHQSAFEVRLETGAAINLRYLLMSGLVSWHGGSHNWLKFYGSDQWIPLQSSALDLELEVGPIFVSSDRILTPFLIVGKTFNMNLTDKDGNGFNKGEGPIFYGGGVGIISDIGSFGISGNLKFIYYGNCAYKAFKVGDQFPLEVKLSPYSITLGCAIWINIF